MTWRALWLSLLVVTACESDDPVADCRALHADCQALCDDICARLEQCTTPGATTCADECEDNYLCAGETPDQDGAICRGRMTMNEGLSCPELCSEASFGQGCP